MRQAFNGWQRDAVGARVEPVREVVNEGRLAALLQPFVLAGEALSNGSALPPDEQLDAATARNVGAISMLMLAALLGGTTIAVEVFRQGNVPLALLAVLGVAVQLYDRLR